MHAGYFPTICCLDPDVLRLTMHPRLLVDSFGTAEYGEVPAHAVNWYLEDR